MTGERLRSWWYAAVPALVALALGVWGLGATGPWLDERYTISALENGLDQHVNEAPWLPYYAIAWLWTGFGNATTIEWVRMLSVVATAAAAVCVAVTAKKLGSTRAGLAAGLVLAMAPGVSRYAQEARTYAVPLALVAASTLLLVLAMRGTSRRWWVAYSIAVALGGLVLAVTFAVVLAHAVLLTTFPGWRSRARDWLAACLFVVPVVALEALLAVWLADTHSWVEAPTWGSLSTAWTWSLLGYAGGTLTLLFAVVVAVAGLTTPTGRRWMAAYVVILGLVLVLSLTVMNWWTARTFVPFAGLLCVAAGLGLARMAWPWLLLTLVALAALTVPEHLEIRGPTSRSNDVREIADILRSAAEPGDILVGGTPMNELPWLHRHYLDNDPDLTVASTLPAAGRRWTLQTSPPCTSIRTWSLAYGGTLTLCA